MRLTGFGVFVVATRAGGKGRNPQTGEEVRVTGFGVFVVSARAGGKGRNPQTGEEITIKASKAARFRAGKPLKDALNA